MRFVCWHEPGSDDELGASFLPDRPRPKFVEGDDVEDAAKKYALDLGLGLEGDIVFVVAVTSYVAMKVQISAAEKRD